MRLSFRFARSAPPSARAVIALLLPLAFLLCPLTATSYSGQPAHARALAEEAEALPNTTATTRDPTQSAWQAYLHRLNHVQVRRGVER